MNGAREYARLFNEQEQVGRLFISSSSHARGRTLHVWVLPDGFTQLKGTWPGKDAVEVYGVIGGHPGWTESYGWLRIGPWQADFERLVTERRSQYEARKAVQAAREALNKQDAEERIRELLATYKS